jgi:hypothetical protein
MASCVFTLHFDTTPDALFVNAREAITAQGGTFVGTPQQGKAALPTTVGTVYWNYLVQGQNLRIEVTDKPWLASCADIQQQMAELVASVPKPTIDAVGVPVPTPVVQPPIAAPELEAAPPPPPFKVTEPPYALWFVGGTLALLSIFAFARIRRFL